MSVRNQYLQRLQEEYLATKVRKERSGFLDEAVKRTGLNHLAFRVLERSDVDRFVNEFLVPRTIAPLYQTPREFPEYRTGYYAVFFEDPDRVKLEVLYLPENREKQP